MLLAVIRAHRCARILAAMAVWRRKGRARMYAARQQGWENARRKSTEALRSERCAYLSSQAAKKCLQAYVSLLQCDTRLSDKSESGTRTKRMTAERSEGIQCNVGYQFYVNPPPPQTHHPPKLIKDLPKHIMTSHRQIQVKILTECGEWRQNSRQVGRLYPSIFQGS